MLRVPQELSALIGMVGLDIWVVILLISLLFFVLGMFLDPISIISITIPILYPIIIHYEINPTWFAILMVKTMELANITPPVGMTVFAVKGLDPHLTTRDAIMACVPFPLYRGFTSFISSPL